MILAAIYTAALIARPNVSSAFQRCTSEAESEVEKTACLDAEFTRQKANLEAAYGLRLQQIGAQNASLLRVAEKAWVSFRGADCRAQMIKGGSAATESWLTCMVRLTADRAREMETYGSW